MPVPDMTELVRLHMQCLERLKELTKECERLRDAGKTREAREVFKQIEEIQARVEALEEHVRPKGP